MAQALAKATAEKAAREAAPRGLPQVPGYEVQAELGRGGMGVVYQAWDPHLKRPVALKFLRAERADHPDLRRRFQAEAEATARLQHPQLVQVFGFGELNGQPYLVQEFVPGGSLAQQIGRQPQPAKEAAAFLALVARAMEHAHRQGIVHRDLKPANLLLAQKSESRNAIAEAETSQTANPRVSDLVSPDLEFASAFAFRLSDFTPKVTDFGLAKLLDVEDGQTKSEALVGTPSYMAPEQAGTRLPDGRRAPITPAVDIYALGAILYEMLTGRPPFQGQTVWDTLDQVLHEEPVPPRRLQPGLPVDLETICLKCLHKEPSRRYLSAAALAEDLERFVRGEPVQARPASGPERLLKWAKRRPALATLAAVSILALLALVLGGAIYNRLLNQALENATRSEAEAQRQRQLAEAARAKADEHYQRALAAVEQFQMRLIDRTADVPELVEIRQQSLEDALGFYRQFLADKDHPDPEVRKRTANALRRMGILEFNLSRYRDAEEHLQQALQMTQQLQGQFPQNLILLREAGELHNDLGMVYQNQGRQKESLQQGKQALELALRATRAQPQADEPKISLIAARMNLGNTYQYAGQIEAAESQYQEGLRLVEELLPRRDVRTLQGFFYFNLGFIARSREQYPLAEKFYRQAYQIKSAAWQAQPHNVTLRLDAADCSEYLADCVARRGDQKEAERLYLEGLHHRQEVVREYPRVRSFVNSLARSHGNLGRYYFYRQQAAQASTNWQEEIAQYRRLLALAPEDPSTQISLATAVANWTCHFDASPAGERHLAEAAAQVEALVRRHPDNFQWIQALAGIWELQGTQLARQKRFQEAVTPYSKAIALLEQYPEQLSTIPSRRKFLCSLLLLRHNLVHGQGDYRAALRDAERLAALEPRRPEYLFLRAKNLLLLGDHRRGIPAIREVFANAVIDQTDLSRLYALAVTALQRDPSLGFWERLALTERYTVAALKTLRHAAGLSFSTKSFLDQWRAQVRQDADFASLRGRAEFQRIVGKGP
jgi:serine/threonine protein kinase